MGALAIVPPISLNLREPRCGFRKLARCTHFLYTVSDRACWVFFVFRLPFDIRDFRLSLIHHSVSDTSLSVISFSLFCVLLPSVTLFWLVLGDEHLISLFAQAIYIERAPDFSALLM